MLLAIYRHLRSSLEDEKRSLDLLRQRLTGSLRAQVTSYIQLRFGISQDSREEAFRRVFENFRSRGEARFGGIGQERSVDPKSDQLRLLLTDIRKRKKDAVE